MSGAVVAQLSLIPDGPLHPDDAVAALIVGVIVGGLFGRRPVAGPLLAAAAATTLAIRHPGFVPEGFLDRPTPVVAIAGMLVATTLAAAALRVRVPAPVHATMASATIACAGVWAHSSVVPSSLRRPRSSAAPPRRGPRWSWWCRSPPPCWAPWDDRGGCHWF